MDARRRCACGLCVVAAFCGTAAPGLAQAPATPPSLRESTTPECPGEPVACDADTAIALVIVVDADGAPSEIAAVEPGDPVLDAIAMDAARAWRFEPARRSDAPVRARVRLAVRFRPHQEAPVAPTPGSESESEGEDESEDESENESESQPAPPDAAVPTYSATGSVDPIAESAAPRSASDVVLDDARIHGAPRRDGGDVLSSAPGVYVTRGEGDGVANAIAVRGFDADHGQDVELTLSGVPLNAPSHVHGQGYTDLAFLLPEILSSVRVTEGVHDPRQGDFAIAGSIDLALGVAQRGLLSRTTYGSFGTFRQALVWAPPGERDGTFAAGAYRMTNGFGAQRGGEQGTLVLQSESVHDGVRLRLLGVLHAARYGLAGVIRYDDVAAGRVAFDGAYDDPAAAAQVAASTRALVAATIETALHAGSFADATLWASHTDFLLRANYTGYALVSDDPDPAVRARGDRFQQTDEALSAGLGGRWRSERASVTDDVYGWLEIGARGRFDARTQAHGLATAPSDVVWRPSISADVRALDVGAWLDLDVHLGDVVRLRGGARAELFAYDVTDHLAIAHVAPLGGTVAPRASIEVSVARGVTLAASYGEGFRSPQGQPLVHLDALPIARVRTGDVGGRFTIGAHDELALEIAGFVSALSSDLVFEADEGALSSVGPTTRVGGATNLAVHPLPWLRGALSATYVRASLDAPPPSTPGAPSEYVAGQALPYVPPLVVRAEASADAPIATVGDLPLRLHASAGFTFLSPRPLPYGEVARAVGLLDASAGIAWGAVDLSVDAFNLLDARYAALEYATQASWTPAAMAVTTPSRAFSAGAPLTILATLSVRVD